MKPWNCDVAFTEPPGIGEAGADVAGVLDVCMAEDAEVPTGGVADGAAFAVCFAYRS